MVKASRRHFIAAAGAATLGLALSDIKLVAKSRRIRGIPTFAHIIASSWDKALQEMRDGCPWNSHVLNQWTDKGRIKIVPLGAHLTIEEDTPGYWSVDDKMYLRSNSDTNLPLSVVSRITAYDVESAHIPVTWTKNDEQRQNTEEKRIAFCAALMQNAVYGAEDYLEMQAKKRKANLIISRDYQLERGPVYQVVNQPAYYFIVSTVVSYVPQSVDLNRVKILTA